jgi:chemotaxis family two-component system sensor kinase Cph1
MTDLLTDLKEQLLIAHEHLPLKINIGATPPVYGDATMIQQVFSNLMGNAIKYSSKTGSPLIVISGERVESQVRYRVSDNGIGIKLHDLDKIFDLFTRSDEVNEYESSGVGLAIVKRLWRNMRGASG